MSGRADSAVSAARGLYPVPFRIAAAEAALGAYLRVLADGVAERLHMTSELARPAPA